MRKFAVLLPMLLTVAVLTAQMDNVKGLKPKQELKLGDRFFAESSFYTASEFYRDVVRQQPENRYATFWLAVSLMEARDYKGSEVFFEKFYSIRPGEKANLKKWEAEDEKLYSKGHYFYGTVLHRNGKYDEAIAQYNKFRAKYKPKEESDNLLKLAQAGIQGCEYARNPNKAKVKVKVLPRGINMPYTELSPVFLDGNTLYFSQLNSDTLVFYKGSKPKSKYRLMRAAKDENGMWSGRARVVENSDINDPEVSVGNGSFNSSRTRFYFTKCLEVADDRPLCNIYVADYNRGSFSNVQRIPEPINSKEQFTATQPACRTTRDGLEIVYFVTDRPGGKGGSDIWYFIRTSNGQFKGPKPLKGPMNTIGDEVTPFYEDSTGYLYFSSNGLPGMGGFDVFRTRELADMGWEAPVNVGVPVNSGADDLFYTKAADQTWGFMTSNREGSLPLNGIATASDDIFGYENFNFAVTGSVFKDGDDQQGSMTGANYMLYKKMPDGSRLLVSVDSSGTTGGGGRVPGKPGNYFFKLEPETDYEIEIARPGFKSKMEAVSTVGLPDEDTITNNIAIKKAAFTAFGRIKEELTGESVSGVAATLIEVSPNGMERNVNYYVTAGDVYSFDIEADKTYKISLRKTGYFANTLVFSTGSMEKSDTIYKDMTIKKLELNQSYTLKNVLYEFGKATLTESSKEVLDMLYGIMKENPTFVVELSAHTDNIGSDAANMKLSQARAQSCVDYLISKGVPKANLVAVGYGESKPKVPNTKDDGTDDPAGRAINRRTEFKILKN